MTLEGPLLADRGDIEGPLRCRSSRTTASADAAYWTVAQLVTHHTVNGCVLSAGDLFGTGTLSGPQPEQAGSLLELTEGGKRSITLSNGEQRSFLLDGDAVTLVGRCVKDGFRSIGFGPCTATVEPAPSRSCGGHGQAV